MKERRTLCLIYLTIIQNEPFLFKMLSVKYSMIRGNRRLLMD